MMNWKDFAGRVTLTLSSAPAARLKRSRFENTSAEAAVRARFFMTEPSSSSYLDDAGSDVEEKLNQKKSG
jgi:hypothetical protein